MATFSDGGTVAVYARLRPSPPTPGLHAGRNAIRVVEASRVTPVSPLRIAEHRAVFNCVLPPAASPEDIYETTAAPLVRAFAAGECSAACIAAFGMAGAGKTWTMAGGPDDFRQRGITPRAVQEVFAHLAAHPDVAADITVRVSYVELVADAIVDLLAGTAEARADWRGRSPFAGGPAAGLGSAAAPSPGSPVHASSLAYGGGVAGSWSAPVAASDAIALRLFYAGEAARRPRSPPAFGAGEGLGGFSGAFRGSSSSGGGGGSSGGGSAGASGSGSGMGVGGAGHAGHGIFTLSMERRVRLGGGRERVDFSKLLLVDLASPARTPVPSSRGVGSASPFTAPSFPHALLNAGAAAAGSPGSPGRSPAGGIGGFGGTGSGFSSPRTPGRSGGGGLGSSAGALSGLFAGANISGGSSSKPRSSPPPVVGGVEASAAAERAASETACINRSLGALERCACAIAAARHAAATAFPSHAAVASSGAGGSSSSSSSSGSPGKSSHVGSGTGSGSGSSGQRRLAGQAGSSTSSFSGELSPPPVSFRAHKLTYLLQDCLAPSLQPNASDIAASGVGGLRAVFIACLSLDPGQLPSLLSALRLASQLGSMGMGSAPGAKAAAADADAGGDALDLTAPVSSPLPSARSAGAGSPRRPATVPRLALSGSGLGDSHMPGSPRSPGGSGASASSPSGADGDAAAAGGAGFAAMAAALSPADRALWRRYTAADGPGGHEYEYVRATQGRLRQAQAHAAELALQARSSSSASASASAAGAGIAAPGSPVAPTAAQQAEAAAAAADVAAAEGELSSLLRRYVAAFRVWAASSQAPLSPEDRPAPWTPGSGRKAGAIAPSASAAAATGAGAALALTSPSSTVRSATAPSPGFRALGSSALAATGAAAGWAWGSGSGSGAASGHGAIADYRGLDFAADPSAAALVDIGGGMSARMSPRGSPVEPLDDAEVFEAVTRARLTCGDDSPAAIAFYEATRGHRERTLQRTGGAHALSPRGVTSTTMAAAAGAGSSTARSAGTGSGVSPRGIPMASGMTEAAGVTFGGATVAGSGMLMRTGRGGY